MTSKRRCLGRSVSGEPCAASPMRDSTYCFWHAPEHEADRTEAQRLGRMRRRREVALGGAYEFNGLNAMDGVWRLLDVAAFDTLGLDNSVQRNRALVAVALAALKAKEVGELEARLATLEQAVKGQRPEQDSPFDQVPPAPFVGDLGGDAGHEPQEGAEA